MLTTCRGILRAYLGKRVYQALYQKYGIGKGDFVMVLLEPELLALFLEWAEVFRREKRVERIFLLTNLPDAARLVQAGGGLGIVVCRCTAVRLRCFQYYTVIFRREKNIQYLSFEKPFGRNGLALAGVKGIDRRDIFRIGILNLGDATQ